MNAVILTPAQRDLLEQGRALVAHCKDCRSDMFLGELPMDVSEVTKISRRAKCSADPAHTLHMGPLP
jgi:hypothetical protein